MSLTTKGFKTLVEEIATATQATASGLVDFTVGSILRASAEAFSQVVLWLQAQLLTVLAMLRASTSTGSDLDSFVEDFGVARLDAVCASGNLVFSRYTATSQGVAPVGAIVSTGDGSQQYTIVADSSNTYYSASEDAYIAPAGTSSITIPGEASTSGTDGDADAGTITLIVSSTITGFDTVTNSAAFTGGVDEETDAALRTRFIAYMGSFRTSNKASIEYAVSSVQSGIRYKIINGKAYSSLAAKPGYFFIIVCTAGGTTPNSLITAVTDAVADVVAEGVQFGVFAPVSVSVNYAMALTVYPSTQNAAAISAAKSAIDDYINTLALGGQTIPMSRLAKLAYDANDYVQQVSDISINDTVSDLVITDLQMPVSGTGSVTAAS